MRKILLGITLLFSIITFSQERVDESKLEFNRFGQSIYPSEWYVENGVWVSKKQFNYVQFKSLTYYGSEYFILIISEVVYNGGGYYSSGYYYRGRYYSSGGYYSSPSSGEQIRCYIFNQTQFKKLKNFEDVISNYSEILNYDNGKTLLYQIKESLDSGTTIFQKYKLKLKKENENTVRFILPFGLLTQNFIKKEFGFDKKYYETTLLEFTNFLLLN